MAVILGLNAKLYRGTAGTTASTLMNNVKDVSLSLEEGDADVTTRAANGWKMSVGTLKEASLEIGMLYDPENADFTAVQSAFLNHSPLAFFVSDGQGNGLDADFSITNFSIEQLLEEAISVSVTAKPTLTTISGGTARAPQWITGGTISTQ